MSYQVIARKYRPQCFADVVGQEHVTQTLANAIKQKLIAHAYLFVGPRGTGKTTIARIFAKCLNCTGGPSDTFPEDDPRCKEITEGRSMDVLEIDGASNRGIEEIRELRETVKYAPASSRYKIYIIDEVHMLTKEAFNALLKTLEEPPEHVKFMFATTEPEKVLPTILSRCQRFDLRRIPASLIVSHLAEIAKKEGVEIDDAALHAIARGAEGGMRDAESTLDQLISFCGKNIVESDVLSMFGLTSRGQILALGGAVLQGNTDAALRELNELARNGKDLGRLLSDLLGHFRNLLIYQVSKGDLSLLETTESEARLLAEQAPLVSAEGLSRIMEVLTDSETKFKEAASKKILLEVGLLKAIQARHAVGIDAVLAKLNEMRGTGPAPAPSAPVVSKPPPLQASPPAPASAPVAQAAAPVLPGAPADLKTLWTNLLDAVGKVKMFTRAYLVKGFPVGSDGRIFTIGFDQKEEASKSFLEAPQNVALIQSKLKELGCGDLHVKLVIAAPPADWAPEPEPAAAPAPAAATAPKSATPAPKPEAPAAAPSAPQKTPAVSNEDFKNDPLIKKALEIFKGQIVEVRSS